jgi:uncharacterized protein
MDGDRRIPVWRTIGSLHSARLGSMHINRTGKWSSALVTGASSGIGEAMVRQLAAGGVPTVIVARRRGRLEALAAELPGLEVLVADLETEDGMVAVEDRLSDANRPVDLLVNNAGFGTSGHFCDLDGRRLGREVDLNCRAVVRLCSAAVGVMTARKRGWILNVSSVAGFQPGPSAASYSATKAYVTSLSEALHEELRGSGVSVTAVCPGFTRTEFQAVTGGGGVSTKAPEFAWLTAAEVARVGLRDTARGRALSVPGPAYKAFTALSAVAPRSVTRRISGLVARPRPTTSS